MGRGEETKGDRRYTVKAKSAQNKLDLGDLI